MNDTAEPTQTVNPKVPVWTICVRNWIATALCAIFFVGWHFGVSRELTVEAVLFFTILCVGCHLAGTLILSALPVPSSPSADFPLSFLLGYIFINSLLFIFALLLPIGVKSSFAVVLGGIALWAAATRIVPTHPSRIVQSNSGAVCVAISLVAATLWAQDSIQPMGFTGSDAILTHWSDGFYHARMISMFANQGPDVPIQGISAAGEPALLYHYAPYILPAALSAFTATPAYGVFGSFMIPVGIFLTGLAAYAIGTSLWGGVGGVAATVTLLLLPDAAQQGIHNYWYSYHWLQQVGPGQLFGVAVLAAAWVYMFDACRKGRIASLFASYALAAICVVYKAHFFIANAFLIWVFPALFFAGLSFRRRISLLAFCTISYWLVLKFAERFPAIPTIKLDGRGLLRRSEWIIENFDGAWIRDYLTHLVPHPGDPRLFSPVWLVVMATIVFVITFGLFAPVLFALAWRLRRAADRMVLSFPFLVVIVYMTMSAGLALNTRGHPDELLHRPFAWAYFVVCAWVGGGAWFVASKWLPQPRLRAIAVAGIPMLFVVPWVFGKAIEVGPSRLWKVADPWTAPAGLVRSAQFIRERSQPADIAQDSLGDGRLILSALAERQPYVQQWNAYAQFGGRPPPIISERFGQITQFKNYEGEGDIVEFARRNRIRWFVVHPEDPLAWPKSITGQPAFESGGYRVFRFAP